MKIQPNSDKTLHSRRGNAMIYVLLALALLGGLTMAMMRGNDSGGDDLSDDQAELLATKVIAYSATAKQAVEQMMISGTKVSSLNFVRPSEAGFDTGSSIHKVYHPQGGSLSLPAADPNIFNTTSNPVQGWYLGRYNNTEWTPTTAQDVLLSAYGVNKSVCEKINKKITGSISIPAFTNSGVRSSLVPGTYHSQGNVTFFAASCPSCDGYASLCASNAAADVFVYYNIISGQ